MKNKIIFWISPDLIQFCLAYHFQKLDDYEIYAVIDTTNKPKKFYQEQKLVNFKKVWYFHDHIKQLTRNPDLEYLSTFEKKYNIDLWKLIINERIFYRFYDFHKFTDNEMLLIEEQACRLFESIIEEVQPDFLITKEPAFHHLELFYEICRAKGVRVMMLSQTNIGFKTMISQEANKLDFLSSLTNVKGTNRNFEDLQKYLKSFNISKQFDKYSQNFGGSKSQLIKAAIQFFIFSDNRNMKTNYNYYGRTKLGVFSNFLNLFFKSFFRKKFLDKHLVTKIDFNEKFVYFPLPVDLERNLLIAAPFYTNTIEVIRHIVKSIPIEYKLYIKEHPLQKHREWRSINEYKEILKIPNVTFFHPSVSSEKLIENCSLVITTVGTAGLEAAFYEKPSIIFSDLGYSLLPSVHRIKNIEELPKTIRESLQKKVDPTDLDKYLILHEDQTFDLDLMNLNTKISNTFYLGGNNVDLEIPISVMMNFLKENNSELEILTTQYITKIKQLKELNPKSLQS